MTGILIIGEIWTQRDIHRGEMLSASQAERPGTDPFLRVLGRNQPYQYLDF